MTTKTESMEGIECDSSKVIGNNTFEYQINGIRIVRLHNTDILIFKPNGLVTYNSGGWKTVTTKARMNEYGASGVYIQQIKSVWHIRAGEQESIFFDGITFDMNKVRFLETMEKDKTTGKWLKLINRYVKKLGELDTLPVPSAGDCFLCSLFDQNLGAGEKSTDRLHLESHLKGVYIHGSLIFNALKWAGYRDPGLIFHMGLTDSIKRAVKRYFKANLGIAG